MPLGKRELARIERRLIQTLTEAAKQQNLKSKVFPGSPTLLT